MAKYTTDLVCIIFGFYCIVITPPLTCSDNETDLLALLAFQASIVDPLGALKSWSKAQNYCRWNGISCGSKHPDRVVEINLMSQGLGGSLSPHVGNLSFLNKINIQNNSFNSEIPQEIGRLRRLEYVDFSNNSFIGEIPRNISRCPALWYLDLNGNSLSGSIPPELGFLLNLEQLGLGKNNLSGVIPPSLGNLTSLVQISLWVCNLEGEIPESFAQLRRLKFLTLPGNSLTGRIPSGLFNISTLIDFGVSSNKLQGVIPDNIDLTLPNLMGLYLGSNQFTGELPGSLSNITSLEIISLEYNSFTGQIPKELGRLPNLKFFITTGNHFQDDINFIASFTNCTNLMTLEVGDNILRGTLPDSMSNLSSQIYNLEISKTQIHGNIPPGIGNLVGLARLFLYDNNLEGPIPFSIGILSNLEDLALERNKLANKIPHSFGNLTMLIHLTLQENNLSRSIPQSLGNCTSLLYLDIADNLLDGSIPPQIMSLPSISIFLLLSDNDFTGSIPTEVGSLTHLSYLDLSNNRLSGLVPNSISGCISLQRLHLDGNLLQGEIPSALSSLKALQDLDLSRNNLSGKIPVFLSHLNLENLNLSFNRLDGEVPIQGVFGNKTAISVEGNKELCGGILELKLPLCPSSKSNKKHLPASLKIFVPTLVAGVLCITLSVSIFTYIYRRKKMKKHYKGSLHDAQFMRLSYGDLLKATRGFSEDNLLGAGRFGTVYKGILDDGKTLVAVKVLNLFARGASKSFIAECIALKGIRHRNLLKLLSVCDSVDFQINEFKALVYEFMANGSLENFLYPREKKEECVEFRSLDILQRLKVAIDIAHALEYLHIGIDSPIIHGDLKPSNVLLDDDMTAHVGDFGLSKVVSSMLEAPESTSTIGIRGTIGYVPPEYGTSNSVSMKGDVYSYGILLLEMFTGKRPTDQTFNENLNLHSFVTSALPNHVTEIVDPAILEGHDMNKKMKECVTSILSVGVACSRNIPIDRMCMTDVVRELCKIRDYYTAQD
ncbi:receptor kinase-like protein Xa21 [Primulina eburnea]|uniref:receptor kinase-like protein Xa21 n=1 Tax=Primulina eburnea TaxID=1245227 RepID=UPI003C6C7930